MTDIEQILGKTSVAIGEGRFAQAEQMLRASLETCTEESDTDIILQQLMHLHSHLQNRDVEKAQSYMDMREARQPAAHMALSQAYFQLHVKTDLRAAKHWVERAIERARAEEDWPTLYSASALNGSLARNSDDRVAVIGALDTMESLIGKDDFTSYGDAVTFLEMTALDDSEIGPKARHLARRIAPLIDDEDFRTRTEALSSGA